MATNNGLFQDPNADLYDYYQNTHLHQQALSGAQNVAQDYRENLHNKAQQMLLDRLAGLGGHFHLKSNDFMTCYVDKERRKVFVFFVFDGESGNTSEGIEIFPSDKLITQLTMIIK
jgi:hypothetical protein